ncbi:MAG: hypothetical protein ACYDHZ_05040 [Dehalococcoidia bacterium]
MKRFVVLSLSLLVLSVLVPGCITVLPPAGGQPPVIGTFSSSPPSVNSGGTSILSWNVTGANSVSIDNGIGQVNGAGSMSVSPAVSTVYTLSATNSAGTVTSTAAITVSSAPPVAFAITSVAANISPTTFTGSCPKTFTLYATMTASGPGTATYRWEREDLRYSATQSVTFNAAGTQTITLQWDFGETSAGWVRVHMLTPSEITSLPVYYTLNCGSY